MGLFSRRGIDFLHLLERHADKTVASVDEFNQLVTLGGDAGARCGRIRDLEHEADGIAHEFVAGLHKTFITPVDRDALHRLMTRMDDVLDFIEAAAARVLLYELRTMTPEAKDLTAVLVRAVAGIHGAIVLLREPRRDGEAIARCREVNRLEKEADEVMRGALARLFREERDALQIIKWKEIYEDLETAVDRCEDVANVIEGIILERG